MIRRCKAANAGHPNPSGKNSYVPPPQVVSYGIFGLSFLEDQQVGKHPKTIPACTNHLLFLHTLIMVDCWELQSLPQSELPPPEEGEPPEGSLGNHGLSCHLCCLLP